MSGLFWQWRLTGEAVYWQRMLATLCQVARDLADPRCALVPLRRCCCHRRRCCRRPLCCSGCCSPPAAAPDGYCAQPTPPPCPPAPLCRDGEFFQNWAPSKSAPVGGGTTKADKWKARRGGGRGWRVCVPQRLPPCPPCQCRPPTRHGLTVFSARCAARCSLPFPPPSRRQAGRVMPDASAVICCWRITTAHASPQSLSMTIHLKC